MYLLEIDWTAWSKSAFGDGSSANVFVGNRPDGLAQRPILEGPRGRTAGSKIQDLGDTEVCRNSADAGDDADFRSDPTIHARISRMTLVQATPSNYYYGWVGGLTTLTTHN